MNERPINLYWKQSAKTGIWYLQGFFQGYIIQIYANKYKTPNNRLTQDGKEKADYQMYLRPAQNQPSNQQFSQPTPQGAYNPYQQQQPPAPPLPAQQPPSYSNPQQQAFPFGAQQQAQQPPQQQGPPAPPPFPQQNMQPNQQQPQQQGQPQSDDDWSPDNHFAD